MNVDELLNERGKHAEFRVFVFERGDELTKVGLWMDGCHECIVNGLASMIEHDPGVFRIVQAAMAMAIKRKMSGESTKAVPLHGGSGFSMN